MQHCALLLEVPYLGPSHKFKVKKLQSIFVPTIQLLDEWNLITTREGNIKGPFGSDYLYLIRP